MSNNGGAVYKVVVLGDANTGKTSIIRRYIQGEFNEVHNVTTLPITQTKKLNIEKKRVELSIWDTAGSEEWEAMNSSIMNGAQGVVFVASIDNEDSLSNAINVWHKKINEHSHRNEYIAFIAINKNDLPEEQRILPMSSTDDAAAEMNARVFFVSAKTGENIPELFETIATSLCQRFTSSVGIADDSINCNCLIL